MALKFLKESELNQIRGKSMVGAATPKEIISVFQHYDLIEAGLNELDEEDFFGTEGWRHFFGLPEGR
jgi:hypothetical protein